MSTSTYQLGLIGLGTMGRNLLLNMADHGFAVTGYDKNPQQVEALAEESAQHSNLSATADIKTFVQSLETPRAIMLLVPAGKIVDYVIQDLLPLLSEGDLIVDGGNSHFPDTDKRQVELAEKGIHFIGVGVSGGAEGARRGPSMMPGGNEQAYETVRPLLEAVSAKVDGEPCVTYLGKGAAGHYVKMVHNGIEYGLMQLIAETYDFLKRGLGLTNAEFADLFAEWNTGELESFLVEITAHIFTVKDKDTGKELVDVILDQSKQKGTGKWTSQDAMNILAPIPVIDVAVRMRELSGYREERLAAEKVLTGPGQQLEGDRDTIIRQTREALYFSFIITYAQGMKQLQIASEEYGFNLDLEAVGRIWRGGCIIRAQLLEAIRKAYDRNRELPNLILDQDLAAALLERQASMRTVVQSAVGAGIPMGAYLNALTYFDAYRSGRLPANLVQAQRDFFGAHTFERLDKEGIFHADWR